MLGTTRVTRRSARFAFSCLMMMLVGCIMLAAFFSGSIDESGFGMHFSTTSSSMHLHLADKVSVVVPIVSDVVFLSNSLHALATELRRVSVPYELILVETDVRSFKSKNGAVKSLLRRSHVQARIVENSGKESLSLGAAMARGAALATGAFVLFMQDNVEVLPAFVSKAVHAMQADSNVHLVSPRLQYHHETRYCNISASITYVVVWHKCHHGISVITDAMCPVPRQDAVLQHEELLGLLFT